MAALHHRTGLEAAIHAPVAAAAPKEEARGVARPARVRLVARERCKEAAASLATRAHSLPPRGLASHCRMSKVARVFAPDFFNSTMARPAFSRDFFDTKLKLACAYRRTAKNTWRCLPTSHLISDDLTYALDFVDSQCTKPLMSFTKCEGPTHLKVLSPYPERPFAPTSPSGCVDQEILIDIKTVKTLDLSAGAVVYRKSTFKGQTTCEPWNLSAARRGFVTRSDGEPGAFVSATLSFSSTKGLAVVQGDDGSELGINTGVVDQCGGHIIGHSAQFSEYRDQPGCNGSGRLRASVYTEIDDDVLGVYTQITDDRTKARCVPVRAVDGSIRCVASATQSNELGLEYTVHYAENTCKMGRAVAKKGFIGACPFFSASRTKCLPFSTEWNDLAMLARIETGRALDSIGCELATASFLPLGAQESRLVFPLVSSAICGGTAQQMNVRPVLTEAAPATFAELKPQIE